MTDDEFRVYGEKWSNKAVPAVSRRVQSHLHRIPTIDLRLAIPQKEQPRLKGTTSPDPDYVRCDFCGTWTHKDKATFGSGELDKTRLEEIQILPSGERIVNETVVHFTRKLTACPNHCLSIVNTKFPDTKG